MNRGISVLCRLAVVPVLALAAASCSVTPAGPPTSGDPGTSGGATTSTDSGTAKHPQRSPFAGLAGYLARRAGHVTAAVYDRRTGRTWLYHPGVRQDTASIVKVEIMGAALREAEAAGRTLSPSERSLILTMIENSNNDSATAMLAEIGGPGALRKFGRLAGLTATTPSTLKYIPGSTLPGWGLTKSTALDQVRVVRKFAYANSLLSTRDRDYGLSLMERVEPDQAWGVSGGVPPGVTVALKNGWLPLNLAANSDWQVNSIGWVAGNGRNYVLAVLTEHDPSEPYGIATVDAIARRVYEKLGRRVTG